MDEHQNVVQPGWKVSDAKVGEDLSPEKNSKFRSNWGERESGFVGDGNDP